MPVSWTSRKVAPVPDRELSRRTYAPLPRELLRSVGRRHAARRPGRLRVIERENSHRSGVLLLGEPMAKRVSRVTLSPFQSLHSSIQLSEPVFWDHYSYLPKSLFFLLNSSLISSGLSESSSSSSSASFMPRINSFASNSAPSATASSSKLSCAPASNPVSISVYSWTMRGLSSCSVMRFPYRVALFDWRGV